MLLNIHEGYGFGFLEAWIVSKIEQKIHALNYESDTMKLNFYQSKLSRK